ncbi:MAG: hypothetical protein JWN44_4211 [Myxococcales bacterium]|nr:hypothetical protein [Myxococcales bacterium]
MKLEAMIDMPCLLTGTWSRFGVHLFHGRVTTRDMDEMEQLGDAWMAKNPGKIVELVIIFPSRERMTGAERTRMSRVIKRREKERTASATVILAQGLTGAVHRSVLTGLLMLVPPPHPVKIFGATREAVAWLAPHVQALCGPTASTEALTGAVEALCAKFQARLEGSDQHP